MGYENLVIVVMVALALLFGAKKLPELARSLGRAQSEFEKAKMDVKQGIGGLGHTEASEKRRKLEDIASKLEIENINSLSDEELHKKIRESIKSDNHDV
jgi:sec-independent protein translocase protein TatA